MPVTTQITLTSSTPQTLASGQVISGAYPGVINTYTLGVANTFSNAGKIIDTSTAYEYPQGSGILLAAGHASTPYSINNTGTIQAGYAGIVVLPGSSLTTATSLVVTNSGVIDATGTSVSDQTAGIFTGTLVNATVINNATGTISGPEGLFIYNQAGGVGTVINRGTITATEPTAKGGYYAVEIQSTSGTNLTGSAVVQNYGVISGTVDLDVANATVLNAGTVTGLIVVFGTGTLTVDPGASSAEGLFAGAGSELILASASTAGDLANPGHYTGFQNIVVASGADWTIGSAGVAAGFSQISAAPTITVLGTTNIQGTLTTTINTSGITNVLSGGQIDRGAVQSGGVVNVKNGGVVSGAVVNNGGAEIISSGGVQSGGVDSGTLTLLSGGSAVSNTVGAGGAEVVSKGGTTTSAVISSGGAETVSSGGVASGTNVLNGGFEYVSSGAYSDNSVVSSGGTEVVEGGGTVSGVIVYSSGTLLISSGGYASGVTVNSGADIVLLSGGTLSNYTLVGGATLDAQVYISSGGFISSLGSATLNYTVPNGYTEFVASGGTATSSIVTSTTSVVVAGGAASSTTVSNGGRLYVSSGQSVVGHSFNAIISSGGTEIVSGNGSVSSSAVASGSLVLSGGTEIVEADGVETGGTVSASGVITLVNGGLAVGETLAPNAIMDIDAGGLADATVVSNRAAELLQGNGAVGSGSVVLSGGIESVQAGGVESGGTVASDGTVLVSSGGTAVGETVLAGGEVLVSNVGGVVSASVISGSVFLSAGNAFVPGGASYGDSIASGGSEAVQSGAITSGTSIAAGGVLLLQTGALTSGSLVDNGQIGVMNTLISASGVSTLAGTGTITGSGTLSISAGVTDFLSGAGSTVALTGSIADAGTITVGAGALFSDTGSISGGGVLSIATGAAATLAAGSLASVFDSGTLIVTGSLTTTINAEGYGANSVIHFTGTDANASISHFGAGDTIIIGGTGLTSAFSGESYNNATGVLSFTDSGNAELFNISIAPATHGIYSAADFTLGTVNGAVEITTDIPCFCSGTRILGINGDILVEEICPGDMLVTVRDGGLVARKVVWTGKRAIDISRHPRPEMVRPVRIIAGAFGDNLPERDLRLSPLHAVYVNGCLFEAISLVNGTTIYQEQNTRHVTYHHIELDAHDVLLAEGLPAESFLDTGDRTMFESASGVVVLHPDFATPQDAQFCAPMIRDGKELETMRDELKARIRKLA
jgi:autotransporter passenger strand-loop-strand repeat protein